MITSVGPPTRWRVYWLWSQSLSASFARCWLMIPKCMIDSSSMPASVAASGWTWPHATASVNATPDGSRPAIGLDAAPILTAITEVSDAIFLPSATSLQESGRYVIQKQLNLEAIRIIR
jgi:hypothetical protein